MWGYITEFYFCRAEVWQKKTFFLFHIHLVNNIDLVRHCLRKIETFSFPLTCDTFENSFRFGEFTRYFNISDIKKMIWWSNRILRISGNPRLEIIHVLNWISYPRGKRIRKILSQATRKSFESFKEIRTKIAWFSE